MIDGIILGVLCYASIVFSFMHFPQFIKNFLLKNFFIADILSVGTTFFFLASISQSILSVIGSIVCGLLVNITLALYGKRRNKLEKNNVQC